MENFITYARLVANSRLTDSGYTGHEYQVRAELKKRLGQEKYEYFFDKVQPRCLYPIERNPDAIQFLEYFFTEEDAKLFVKLGMNCLRIPVSRTSVRGSEIDAQINYRHFEDDANPRVIKEYGFRHLDRVIDICTKHQIYTVIDLHALPGGEQVSLVFGRCQPDQSGQNNDWHCDSGSHQPNCEYIQLPCPFHVH